MGPVVMLNAEGYIIATHPIRIFRYLISFGIADWKPEIAHLDGPPPWPSPGIAAEAVQRPLGRSHHGGP